MKTNILYLGVLMVCLTACKKDAPKTDETVVKTDSIASETAETPMDSVAMMKAWEEYATPNDNHKRLAADVGLWDEELTMWMGADAKPTTSKMTVDVKMIYDGRYQVSVHTGNFMGAPFEGTNIVAYDNAAQEYVSTWMDNMGTGIVYVRGKYDDASKTVNYTGECIDPLTKKKKPVKEVVTYVDADTQKMVAYDVDASGKEYKSMEIVMTRKK